MLLLLFLLSWCACTLDTLMHAMWFGFVGACIQKDLKAGRMQDQLLAIRSTAEPVRAKFGIPALQRPPGQLRAAALLPLPLHVAYTQLAAANEAFELGAEVTILGAAPHLQPPITATGTHCASVIRAAGLSRWSPRGGSATCSCMCAGSLAEAQALVGGEASPQLMEIDEAAAEGGSIGGEDGEEAEAEDEAELEPGEHRPTKRRRSVAELSEAGQRVRFCGLAPVHVSVTMCFLTVGKLRCNAMAQVHGLKEGRHTC